MLFPGQELKTPTALPAGIFAEVNLHRNCQLLKARTPNGGSGFQSGKFLWGVDFDQKSWLAMHCIQAVSSYEAETNGSLVARLQNGTKQEKKRRKVDVRLPGKRNSNSLARGRSTESSR